MQFHDRIHQNYHSDPNLLRSAQNTEITIKREKLKPTISTDSVENSATDNPKGSELGGKVEKNVAAQCDERSQNAKVFENSCKNERDSCYKSVLLDHKLLTKLQSFCFIDLNPNECSLNHDR